MRHFTKAAWIKLADIQTLKTRRKEYRVLEVMDIGQCASCDMQKHRSMCAKIKCHVIHNDRIERFILKEIV